MVCNEVFGFNELSIVLVYEKKYIKMQSKVQIKGIKLH